MSGYRILFLLMFIVMAAQTSTPKTLFSSTPSSQPSQKISTFENYVSSNVPPISEKPNSSYSGEQEHQSKRRQHGFRYKKGKKNGIVVFRPYNFTVEKMSGDTIRIRWQKNIDRTSGPRTSFSIKVLPYETKQYFEAHITDLTNNIVLHGLSPDTQYNLVVAQNDDILLNKSLLVGEGMSSTTPDTLSPTNATLYYHPSPSNKVRVEEIVIVSFILVLWVCAISLFVHRWGKIRMLVPHQPPYAEVVPSDQTKVLVSGSRHNLSSLDPNHPNFTSVCSSSNYSATAAAVKAAGTTIGVCSHRPVPPTNSTSILLACERARLWRARTRSHQIHNNHIDTRQNSVLSENNAANNEMHVSRLRTSSSSSSRRVKSALDLRESFKNKSLGGMMGPQCTTRSSVEPMRSRENFFRRDDQNGCCFLQSDSEQGPKGEEAQGGPSTIVVISGVHSDIKMSVLNDPEQKDVYCTTKDTQV